MNEKKLICGIGDTVYYITAWDMYAHQKDHETKIKEISIKKESVWYITENDVRLLDENYQVWWFTNKEQWLKVIEILRKTRKEIDGIAT